MRLMPHQPWPRLLLAALLLLAQLGVPAHGLAMRMAASDSIATLLADPSAYCHSSDRTIAPEQPGPAQAPMSHGDCLACGVCQMAGAAPLLSASVRLPAPVLAVAVLITPVRQDRLIQLSTSPTPPARAPPISV